MKILRAVVRVVAVAGLTLLLSGCIKAHQIMTLNEDNTVDGSLIFAVSKELVELSGQDADSVLDEMTQGDTPLPEGIDFESKPYDDGEFVGQEFTFSGASLEDMSGDGEITITREGDTFVVDGSADLSQGADGVDLSDPTTAQLLEAFDVKVSITFPGAITDSNGEVDGNTVTWVPEFGGVTSIHAKGSAIGNGGGGGGILLWVLLGVAAIVVIGVVMAVMKRGKDTTPAGDAVAEGDGAVPTDDAMPAPAGMPSDPPVVAPPMPEAPSAPEAPAPSTPEAPPPPA